MNHKVVSALPKVKLPTFATYSHGVTGGALASGTYSPYSDPLLLAIPTSRSRAADSNPTTTHFTSPACSRGRVSSCMRHIVKHVCSPVVRAMMTWTSSHLPSSLSLAALGVPFNLTAGNKGRRRCDLTQHFTTRADDSRRSTLSPTVPEGTFPSSF